MTFKQQYTLFITHENHRISNQLGIQLSSCRNRDSYRDDNIYPVFYLDNQSLHSATEKSKVAPTHHHFLKNAVALLLWVFALISITYVVPSFRNLAVALFASAGVLLAILGLAGQQALTNIVSGIFIVIFKPFHVGDFVTVADKYTRTVEDITLRHTVITNFENRRVIIPNSVVSTEVVINSSISDQKICESVVFEISYESNIDLAKKIIQEEAEKHPLSIDNRSKQDKKQGMDAFRVCVVGFGDSSVKLKGWIWVANPHVAFDMRYDLNESVKERFDKEGIEIPYPHRTILYKDHISNKATDCHETLHKGDLRT